MKIKQIFAIKKGGKKIVIAGCEVLKGTLKRGADVQIRRDGEVVFTGKYCEVTTLMTNRQSTSVEVPQRDS